MMGRYEMFSEQTGVQGSRIFSFLTSWFFDVTYKNSKFKMPFALFTGVNHHLQSSLFGGALLEDATTETFVWLFSQFRRCMFERPPYAHD